MEDRRLPRPIGGERAWKNTGNTGGNIPPAFAPFATLDCLDTPPHLPQPIIAPQIPKVHGGHNMCHGGQQQPWLGMYGSSNQQPQGYPSNNPPPPIQGPNRDGRNNYQGMGKFGSV